MALKLGYLGTNYHGFQIQPDVATIESELFRAFQRIGLFEDRRSACYSAAGRTDKGVHALAQVVSFETSRPDLTPRMINGMLPDDIWVYAIARPRPEFDARRDAVSRKYRYFLYPHEDLDLSRMQEASELLIGVHNFYNFAQRHEASSYIREIMHMEVRIEDPFIIFDVEANSFLRKMVRKLVSALCMVGRGERDMMWLKSLLELRHEEGIAPAPAHGLVLWDVVYNEEPGFVLDEYVMNRIEERLKHDLCFHATIARVLQELIRI